MITHEIAALAKLNVQPTQWRILQSIDGSFSLEFSHQFGILTGDLSGIQPKFELVGTRRGKAKNYKSLKAVFTDITKVQSNPLIHYEASQVG